MCQRLLLILGEHIPSRESRLKGFYQLSVNERLELLKSNVDLSEEDIAALTSTGELSLPSADMMIENVIGTMSLPIGIGTNFLINQKPYLIPFCVEESSIVAAASNMAKRCLTNGGFSVNCDDPIMIGQVQILDLSDIDKACAAIEDNQNQLIEICNDVPSTMIRLGGGCKEILTRVIESDIGPMLIVHLLVDCRDAMGANAVNSMAERIAPHLESITGGRVHLRILSNLATHRMARASATFTAKELSSVGKDDGNEVIEAIIEAYTFAKMDPYRATTHNKGIMNAISAIALACGQDWRAIEAGCHAWASMKGMTYTSMTEWFVNDQGNLVGTIEVPLAVGIVGGASKIHPAARANLKILGVQTAQELAGVMACAGLAQNLGAMRALATDGIQSGHMRMHLKNMAISEGATQDEVMKVVQNVLAQNLPVTHDLVREAIDSIRS